MEISGISSGTLAAASASQQLQTVMETQMSILRELAESQQQIAQMLVDSEIGQNIDVSA